MRRTAIGLVLALLALLPADSPTQAAASGDCGPKSATTVTRNRLARLYFIQRGPGDKRYYACARPGGKPISLDYPLAQVVLRGRYVSDTEDVCDTSGCWFLIQVTDVLRNDQVTHATDLPGRARRLVASARGEAAAIGVMPGGAESYVVKVDALGMSEIDRGPDVRNLTLRGRSLQWLHGAEQRTAPIAHVSRCGRTRGVDPVVLNPHIRIYGVDVSNPDVDEEYVDYYACLRPGGKPLKIARVDVTVYSGSLAYGEYIPEFVFARDYVAFSNVGCSNEDCVSDFSVFDVRRRRRVHRAKDILGSVGTIVLTPRGHSGVLVSYDARSPAVQFVLAFDSSGKRELDRGSDVRDLTLDGNTLRWFNGSEARSAELR